jgi:ActR/RegA family two-component response regulator
VARLNARREEIESAVLTRTFAIDDPSGIDPNYVLGLRAAVSAAVKYGLEIIDRGEEHAPAPPPLLLSQARLAAGAGVGLDTVLRRYSAGYVLLTGFLIEEAERSRVRGTFLQRLLRAQASLDRLLAAVSEEYAREQSDRAASSEERRAERIERLLAGEQIDTSDFAYDFDGFHVGAIAKGSESAKALQGLAARLDCRTLLVRRSEETVWVWLGRRCSIDVENLRRRSFSEWPAQATLAIGEPSEGMSGWRLTHRQARTAFTVAQRSPEPMVRYADVALPAAILNDELCVASLRKLYLEPLEAERDGGEIAFETLRAYFATGRNISSAAAVLGVSRRTVSNRLRMVEERIGRPLGPELTELDAALRLEALEEQTSGLPFPA